MEDSKFHNFFRLSCMVDELHIPESALFLAVDLVMLAFMFYPCKSI